VERSDRVVEQRAGWRPSFGPDLEIGHADEGRNIVPSAAMARSSTCSRCIRKVSRSFAALLFLLNDQMPQKNG